MDGDAKGAAAPVLAMSRVELEELLAAAAKRGADQALAAVGLADAEASRDVREFRDLLDSWRAVRRGAFQAVGKGLAVIFLAGVVAAVGGGALVRKLAE